jgi:hypothetical protein
MLSSIWQGGRQAAAADKSKMRDRSRAGTFVSGERSRDDPRSYERSARLIRSILLIDFRKSFSPRSPPRLPAFKWHSGPHNLSFL